MGKKAKHFFVAVVALSAFTACSDSNFTEVESGVPTPDGITVNSAVLTDESGKQISTVSSNFGTYYLDIKTDGAWYIETEDNMEFTPTKMLGRGSARVPVMIGNNWAEARQLSYKVKFVSADGTMRRAGEGENAQQVNQESSTNLAKFKEIVNSNIMVGYGYSPTKNSIPELCTGIEIFKMDSLNNENAVKSSLVPTAKEEYFSATSDTVMDKIVAVSANPGGNFGVVKLDLKANVNVTRLDNRSHTVVQKSLVRSVYSRELEFAGLQNNEKNLTDGFKYYKNRFIRQLAAATNNDEKTEAVVGTHFIAKATLGCELDYRISVDSSKTVNSTSVKTALDFKWQQQVKDTTKVDSALVDSLKKANANLKNFVFKGNVQVTDSTFMAATSTKASVKARGGDVELVNMLATGGSISCVQLAKWLLGTAPEKAVMVGFDIKPIYYLFDDSKDTEKDAYNYLKEIIDANYNLNDEAFKKLNDL